jgi:hypothetical protein
MPDDEEMPDEEMVPVPGSPPIDLRTWQLWESDDGQRLNEIVMQAVTDIVRMAFEESPPYLHFPFAWSTGDGCGGPAVSDPATLYVGLPLAEQGGDWCQYACSLEGAVNGLIDLLVSPETGKIEDVESIERCSKVAARLRELAGKIDAACEPTENKTA